MAIHLLNQKKADAKPRAWTRQEVLATMGLQMRYPEQSEDEAQAVFVLFCPQKVYVTMKQEGAGPLSQAAFVARKAGRGNRETPPPAIAGFCARQYDDNMGAWYFLEGPGAKAEADRAKGDK